MIRAPQKMLDPNVQWIDPKTGKPTREFYQYLRELDQAIRQLIDAVNILAP